MTTSPLRGENLEETAHRCACALHCLAALLARPEEVGPGESEAFGLYLLLSAVAHELRGAAGTLDPEAGLDLRSQGPPGPA